MVTGGTKVVVGAGRVIKGIHTSDGGDAGIRCAQILVVAGQIVDKDAFAFHAMVIRRTQVAIVTVEIRIQVDATQVGVATIVGARVVIFTVQLRPGYTTAAVTGIAGCTLAAIFTWD
jgi:uncharacterized membrane protein